MINSIPIISRLTEMFNASHTPYEGVDDLVLHLYSLVPEKIDYESQNLPTYVADIMEEIHGYLHRDRQRQIDMSTESALSGDYQKADELDALIAEQDDYICSQIFKIRKYLV